MSIKEPRTAIKPQALRILIPFLFLIGCTPNAFSKTPTPTPTPTDTPAPTASPTPAFTATLAWTDTPVLVSPLKPACASNELFLYKLQFAFDVEDVVIFYQSYQGIKTLGVWIVDPGIITGTSQNEDFVNNQNLAIDHALIAAYELKDACARANNFDLINPIVVDTEYNGWVSGALPPGDIPDYIYDGILPDMFEFTQFVFIRQETPPAFGSPPDDSCTWDATLDKIQRHFRANDNVVFYYIRDPNGNNLWAQWYVRSQEEAYFDALPSILNIARELDCLYPTPDMIFTMVMTGDDKVVLLGALANTGADTDVSQNGFDINNFRYTIYD